MPTYTYICNKCQKTFETFYTFSEYDANPQPKCLHCGHKKTHRSYCSDIAESCGFVKKNDTELQTLGDLANRNRDRMSDDQKIELYHKHNEYKDQPSMNNLPKGMSRMKKPSIKNKWY